LLVGRTAARALADRAMIPRCTTMWSGDLVATKSRL
jgi:hypothetical protein